MQKPGTVPSCKGRSSWRSQGHFGQGACGVAWSRREQELQWEAPTRLMMACLGLSVAMEVSSPHCVTWFQLSRTLQEEGRVVTCSLSPAEKAWSRAGLSRLSWPPGTIAVPGGWHEHAACHVWVRTGARGPEP